MGIQMVYMYTPPWSPHYRTANVQKDKDLMHTRLTTALATYERMAYLPSCFDIVYFSVNS